MLRIEDLRLRIRVYKSSNFDYLIPWKYPNYKYKQYLFTKNTDSLKFDYICFRVCFHSFSLLADVDFLIFPAICITIDGRVRRAGF
jgi:hypothetical protein